MKPKLLWISLCAPYDNVGHGGGKTHNYYLKEIQKSNKFDIQLITFCEIDEFQKDKKDLDSYKINNTIIPWTHDINFKNIVRKIQLIDMEYNIFNEYGGATNLYYWSCIKEEIEKIDYTPDIIILQWTEIVLFTEKIKRIFPDSKIVVIEEDVKYLSYRRKAECEQKVLSRYFKCLKLKKLMTAELDSVKLADLIITYSNKDKNLLGNAKNKTIVLSPYFQDLSYIKRNKKPNNEIIFYGAMSRQDNYDSAVWFIKNVFDTVSKMYDLKFVIIGNKPDKSLFKYASDKIIITGFMEKIDSYFENSLCLVAPLVSGAGIKIKILEALSSGIPTLTNDIGIEGIEAKKGRDYFHCENPKDYIKVISDIINNKVDMKNVFFNSKKTITDNYNLQNDREVFIDSLERMYYGE